MIEKPLKLFYKAYLGISCAGFIGLCIFFIYVSLKAGALEINFNAFSLFSFIFPLAGLIGLSSYVLYALGVRNMMLLGPMAMIGIVASLPLFFVLILGDGLYYLVALSLALLVFEAIRIMIYEAYLNYKDDK